MPRPRQSRLAVLALVILVSGMLLAACGSTPTATPAPAGTLRPTFTPVTPEQPTAEPTLTTAPVQTPAGGDESNRDKDKENDVHSAYLFNPGPSF